MQLAACQIRDAFLGLAVILICILTAPAAWGVGTASGLTISSSATVSYDFGGSVQPPITKVVSFVVDNKVNMTVVEVGGGATAVIADPLLPVTSSATFTVTNHGNTTQDFALAVANLVNGTVNPFGGALVDNYDGGPCAVSNIVIAAGSMGPYAGPAQQYINALAADSSATVTVSCTTPAAQANNSLAVISLKATARDNDGANTLGAALANDLTPDQVNTVQVVFVDAAGSDDVAIDGAYSVRDAFLAGTVILTLTKEVLDVTDVNGRLVLNPLPGDSALIPKSTLTYRITAVMVGQGTANNLVVKDVLPASLTYMPGTLSVACVSGNFTVPGACGVGVITTPQVAASKTDSNVDADFADFTGNTVSVSLGNVAVPANVVITFRATIN
ncbi:MAG: hypothetical protein C0406_01830 [Sideroxydans sp.]|nr:hypothetical protein [Sideroxydans sp.]